MYLHRADTQTTVSQIGQHQEVHRRGWVVTSASGGIRSSLGIGTLTMRQCMSGLRSLPFLTCSSSIIMLKGTLAPCPAGMECTTATSMLVLSRNQHKGCRVGTVLHLHCHGCSSRQLSSPWAGAEFGQVLSSLIETAESKTQTSRFLLVNTARGKNN